MPQHVPVVLPQQIIARLAHLIFFTTLILALQYVQSTILMLVACVRLAPIVKAVQMLQIVSFVQMDTIYTKEDAIILAHQWLHMQTPPLLHVILVRKVVQAAAVMEVIVFHAQVGI